MQRYGHHDQQDKTDQLRQNTEPGRHEGAKMIEERQERIQLQARHDVHFKD